MGVLGVARPAHMKSAGKKFLFLALASQFRQQVLHGSGFELDTDKEDLKLLLILILENVITLALASTIRGKLICILYSVNTVLID